MRTKIVGITVLALSFMGLALATNASAQYYKSFDGTLLRYDSTGRYSESTVVDASHTIQYKVDNGSWTDGPVTGVNGFYSYTPNVGDTIAHTIYVRAKDKCFGPGHRDQHCNQSCYPYCSTSASAYHFGDVLRTYPCIASTDRGSTWKPGTK